MAAVGFPIHKIPFDDKGGCIEVRLRKEGMGAAVRSVYSASVLFPDASAQGGERRMSLCNRSVCRPEFLVFEQAPVFIAKINSDLGPRLMLFDYEEKRKITTGNGLIVEEILYLSNEQEFVFSERHYSFDPVEIQSFCIYRPHADPKLFNSNELEGLPSCKNADKAYNDFKMAPGVVVIAANSDFAKSTDDFYKWCIVPTSAYSAEPQEIKPNDNRVWSRYNPRSLVVGKRATGSQMTHEQRVAKQRALRDMRQPDDRQPEADTKFWQRRNPVPTRSPESAMDDLSRAMRDNQNSIAAESSCGEVSIDILNDQVFVSNEGDRPYSPYGYKMMSPEVGILLQGRVFYVKHRLGFACSFVYDVYKIGPSGRPVAIETRASAIQELSTESGGASVRVIKGKREINIDMTDLPESPIFAVIKRREKRDRD